MDISFQMCFVLGGSLGRSKLTSRTGHFKKKTSLGSFKVVDHESLFWGDSWLRGRSERVNIEAVCYVVVLAGSVLLLAIWE